MEAIRTWSYARLHSHDVWDWASGDLAASDWPQPTQDAADVTYEDDGRRVLVRGVFTGGPPANQVVPRQLAVTREGLEIELEEIRRDADFVVDVGTHVPYEITVELCDHLDESDRPGRTIVRYHRNDAVVFEAVAER